MIRSTLCILTKQTMEPSTTAYFQETLFKDVGGAQLLPPYRGSGRRTAIPTNSLPAVALRGGYVERQPKARRCWGLDSAMG
jgi:hypothetical protein